MGDVRFDLYNIDSYELIVKTHAENKLSRMDRSPPFCTAQFRNPDHNPDYTALNPSFKIIKKIKELLRSLFVRKAITI